MRVPAGVDGRPELARTSRAVIVAAVAASDSSTSTSCTAGWAGSAVGVVAFGFTVMTGTPEVTAEVTVNDAAKADWVATTACSSALLAPGGTTPPSPPETPGLTSTASLMKPASRRSASLAPISLPSVLAVSSTAARSAPSCPVMCAVICSSASTFGTTRWSSIRWSLTR